MEVDKLFCMSSYLMYRAIVKPEKVFCKSFPTQIEDISFSRNKISTSDELIDVLKVMVAEATADGKAAVALSGGIDSAILAKFMPKGSTAYTFKCVVPGVAVTDETEIAATYAKICGLEHKIVEIYWDDVLDSAPILMKHNQIPRQ